MVPLSMTMKIYHSMGRAMKGPSLEFKNRLGSRLMGLDTNRNQKSAGLVFNLQVHQKSSNE